MGKRRRPSRAMRNQAKWDAHKITQEKSDVTPGLAGYAGGEKPQLVTGSIQAAPGNVRVTRPRGIKLQPFSDYVPPVPTDYATIKTDHVRHDKMVWGRIVVATGQECKADEAVCIAKHGDKCEPGRVWERVLPDKSAMDFERVKLSVRPSHEAATMAADRASGAENFQTYAQRHDDDKKAGLYRDGLGRIMRTEDMDDPTDGGPVMTHDWRESDPVHLTCEVDEETRRVRIMVVNERTGERQPRGKVVVFRTEGVMTTTDYAQMHGVPVQRNATQRASAKAKEKALKAEAREAKKAARQQEQAERAARRQARMTGKGASTRAEANAAARAHLTKLGVPESGQTPALIKAAREALEYKAQVAEYTGEAV